MEKSIRKISIYGHLAWPHILFTASIPAIEIALLEAMEAMEAPWLSWLLPHNEESYVPYVSTRLNRTRSRVLLEGKAPFGTGLGWAYRGLVYGCGGLVSSFYFWLCVCCGFHFSCMRGGFVLFRWSNVKLTMFRGMRKMSQKGRNFCLPAGALAYPDLRAESPYPLVIREPSKETSCAKHLKNFPILLFLRVEA